MGKCSWRFLVILTGIFLAGKSYTQALDPNCWKPTVGMGIETFKKSTLVQPDFGSGIIRVPNSYGDSFHYVIGTNDGTPPYLMDEYQSGKPFSFSSLKLQKKIQLDLGTEFLVFGHFHSPQLFDVLIPGNNHNHQGGVGVIYWADENGDYDTLRYTVLRSTVHGDYGFGFKAGIPYVAHLTSDSLEDILTVGYTDWNGAVPDSLYKAYAILYQGGYKLFHSDTLAYNDSLLFWGPAVDSNHQIGGFGRNPTTADFRGVGRRDWLGSDDKSNIFFFKNDPPFSMLKFVEAGHFDTLLAAWQNPLLFYGDGEQRGINRFTMKALPKLSSDSSMDFMPTFVTFKDGIENNYLKGAFWIFRGGKDFGSKRLLIDSSAQSSVDFQPAEFILQNPAVIDGKFNGMDRSTIPFDCGDMTGTGRPVIKIGGAVSHGSGYDFYYVLGDAIDSKADVLVSYPIGASTNVIPIDADGDKYGDVLFHAYSDYPNGSLTPDSSGLWILHGSPLIPIHLNPKYSVVNSTLYSNDESSAYPNPANSGTTVTFSLYRSGTYELILRDILGRKLDAREFVFEQGRVSLYVSMQSLPNGTYFVNIIGEGKERIIRVVVHH